MQALKLLFVSAVTVTAQVQPKDQASGGQDWTDVVQCFRLLTNQTTLSPGSANHAAADVSRELFKAICSTKDQFLECMDSSLRKAQGDSVLRHFRPLFNVSLVTEAYNDLCTNDTVTRGDQDLSCLVNSTALLPCYTEYYNYLFYLSVVKRFGSRERQLPDDVVNTLLCTLAEERRDCEVEALKRCSTKIGEVMQTFYQKTLPAVCREDETDERPGTQVSTPTNSTPTSG